MRNFSSILRWHAERTPEKIAIRFEGKEIPYEELDLTTSSFASSIKAHGGRPNEIVAILLYNTPEFYYAAIGANKAGLAFLPLNYRLAREEIKYILSNSQAKFLVTQSQFKDQVDQIRNELPDLSTCLIVDGPSDEGWINFNSFVSRSGERISHVDYEPTRKTCIASCIPPVPLQIQKAWSSPIPICGGRRLLIPLSSRATRTTSR